VHPAPRTGSTFVHIIAKKLICVLSSYQIAVRTMFLLHPCVKKTMITGIGSVFALVSCNTKQSCELPLKHTLLDIKY